MSNKQKIDYLKEDPDIFNQRFCCLSFIEPRDQKIATKKEIFMASKFLHNFIQEYETAKEFSENKNNVINDDIVKKMDLSESNIMESYNNYRKFNFTSMSNEFDNNHNPTEAVNISGIKVRGSYRTYEEAQERANEMREYEPAVNVLVGQVGYWLPYDPENMEDIQANFREEQLNEIYGKRQDNLKKAKQEFKERELEKKAAIEKEEQRKKAAIEKEKLELKASQTMKTIIDDTSHQEKKEDIIIIDPPNNKPNNKPKNKPVAAQKAGNMRLKNKRN